MVARIVTGKSIKGAVNYNEEKVRKGLATLIGAQGYTASPEHLTFKGRLLRLERLAAGNSRAKTNCVHISLNFEPAEKLSDEKMTQIAERYMQGIGLGAQPFLVYRHTDAGHPHMHIVTTNIQSDGQRISLHNIGKEKSEPIRKEIEQRFGLVPSEGREKDSPYLKPADLEAASYGKSGTKKAISNIVRTVVREYNFTTLAELNAVLRSFNVVADRGEPDSKMFAAKGLCYFITDAKGNKVGVPIKASAIYSKPTLPSLEEKFVKNAEQRWRFKTPLKNAIDKAVTEVKDADKLVAALKADNIDVVFRRNPERIYGVTFVDHRSMSVFNGSDLGKNYSAAQLLARLTTDDKELRSEIQKNKVLSEKAFEKIDFDLGIAATIGQLYNQGLRLLHGNSDAESFTVGSKESPEFSYVTVPQHIEKYFRLHLTAGLINGINELAKLTLPGAFLAAPFLNSIKILLEAQQQDIAFYVSKRPKRKRKR
ncbi:relaxase/mobilization nuclease domain-containing protein [Niabella sp. CJ426]|uniref:relaxase/mobilization nuclease domain-containing protein n=1 Tax=Niabella sp. CJ426 TaxID=3393740 RepID=UPI003D0882E8